MTKAVKTLPTQSFESVRKPSAAEVEGNPRAQSARLRAVERLIPAGGAR